jgi:hypothetical protein
MQATKGQANIESQITRIDNKTKSWLHKGRVTVSCEAQQYKHFIRSEKPVCWHLVAFMGGFGSALFGEKVYYKETKCIEHSKLLKFKTKKEYFLLKKNILCITNNHLRKAYPAVICADVKNNLAIFLPEKTTDHSIILDICYTLKKEIESKFPMITILFGIGGITQNCQNYSENVLKADKTVQILRSFNKKDSVLFYDDLGSLAILFEVDKKQDLLEFMKRKLGPLIEYDSKHNSELIMII